MTPDPKAQLAGSISVLREVVHNPNRKSYYMELLNEALKRQKLTNKSREQA